MSNSNQITHTVIFPQNDLIKALKNKLNQNPKLMFSSYEARLAYDSKQLIYNFIQTQPLDPMHTTSKWHIGFSNLTLQINAINDLKRLLTKNTNQKTLRYLNQWQSQLKATQYQYFDTIQQMIFNSMTKKSIHINDRPYLVVDYQTAIKQYPHLTPKEAVKLQIDLLVDQMLAPTNNVDNLEQLHDKWQHQIEAIIRSVYHLFIFINLDKQTIQYLRNQIWYANQQYHDDHQLATSKQQIQTFKDHFETTLINLITTKANI